MRLKSTANQLRESTINFSAAIAIRRRAYLSPSFRVVESPVVSHWLKIESWIIRKVYTEAKLATDVSTAPKPRSDVSMLSSRCLSAVGFTRSPEDVKKNSEVACSRR